MKFAKSHFQNRILNFINAITLQKIYAGSVRSCARNVITFILLQIKFAATSATVDCPRPVCKFAPSCGIRKIIRLQAHAILIAQAAVTTCLSSKTPKSQRAKIVTREKTTSSMATIAAKFRCTKQPKPQNIETATSQKKKASGDEVQNPQRDEKANRQRIETNKCKNA